MIRIGKIVNCHGHKGELKILPLTDDLARFENLKEAYLERPAQAYQLVHPTSARVHKNNILMMLQEVPDMNAAERLKNSYLCVKREDAITLPEDHFFIQDIIGLTVVEAGIILGVISDVIVTGSNDVYEVKNDQRVFYLPALKTVVQEIDFDNKRMIVTLPLGLLD